MSLVFLCLAAAVVDGDTLRCESVENENGRVRLARIDTPERGEAGFEEASRALTGLIKGRRVVCRLVDANPFVEGFQPLDKYGRPVARCKAGGVDLSEAQLRGGFARGWP